MPMPAIRGRIGSLDSRAIRLMTAALAAPDWSARRGPPPLHPLMDAPGAARFHLADEPVDPLVLGVGPAEMGRLLVRGGVQPALLAVDPLQLGRQPGGRGLARRRLLAQAPRLLAHPLVVVAQRLQLAVDGVKAVLEVEAFR